MKSMMRKTTFREIRQSFGRYAAILAIIGLGVGFFSGLTVTKTAMVATTDQYIRDLNLFDYRIISLTGLTEEDVDAFSDVEGVEYAEGAYYADAIMDDADGVYVARILSCPDNVNQLSLVEGRLPEKSGECVVDCRFAAEKQIGSTISLSDTNEDATMYSFNREEYTIVGTVYSPLYLNYERGSTSVGNGALKCFIYIEPEDFALPVYTDIYCTLNQKEFIYSDAYDNMISDHQQKFEDLLEERTAGGFVLTRDSNVGYACFENDSDIVAGIATVFPVFFFLVAALVCITTMNRMVEEQRTQIGVLKALGYSQTTIMGKYMIYSGSAAVLGCVIGFIAGSYAFPKIIWIVYGLMYGFTEIQFLFDWKLFIIAMLVSLICSIGTTWVSCRYELGSMAAELIRPKSPKNGKRILLEHVPFIWKHLKFLYKVSIRNVLRYKKRFFMMILGIGGCTGLIVTGFGIKDSIANIANQQYDEIQIYDYAVTFREGMSEEAIQAFETATKDYLEQDTVVMESSADLIMEDGSSTIQLIIPESVDEFSSFVDLHTVKGEPIPYPQDGEVVITENMADKYHIETGDMVTIRNSDMHEMELQVSAVCENYFMSYAFVRSGTYKIQMGIEPVYKSAYANVLPGKDLHEASAYVMNLPTVSAVSVIQDIKDRFSQMMKSMDYIVLLVITCAAALAFIVLYNLTNINITERIREIATIKVLGFYPMETASYVFRENLALTGIGAIVGLPLGYLLHQYVMNEINIDLVNFDVHINTASYWYAILFTFAFAIIVDVVMYFKLKRVNMAESLKSIE